MRQLEAAGVQEAPAQLETCCSFASTCSSRYNDSLVQNIADYTVLCSVGVAGPHATAVQGIGNSPFRQLYATP